MALLGALTLSYLLLPAGDARELTYSAVGLASMAVAFWGMARRRPSRGSGWLTVLLGYLVWVLGDVTFLVEQRGFQLDSYPAPSDAVYIAAYGLLAAGLVAMIGEGGVRGDLSGVLDATILATGLAVVAGVFVIFPIATDSSLSALGKITASLYPIADVLLLGILARVWTMRGGRTAAFRLLGGSLAMTLFADVLYNFTVIATGDSASLPINDVLWMVAYVLIAAAVWAYSPRETPGEARGDRELRHTSKRLVVLTGGLLLPPLALVIDSLTDGSVEWQIIAGGSVVLSMLVLARMSGLVRRVQNQAKQVAVLARSDPLTGLPNRRTWDRELESMIGADAQAGTHTGLLLIDLDRFKEVNDTFGHQYGDDLLKQIGPRFTGALSQDARIARLGGDEFAVLLPDIGSAEAALCVAGDLKASLRAPFDVLGVNLNVDASIGVVVSGEDGTDANVLLQRADIAMYVAKSQGCGVYPYRPAIDAHSPARMALLGELRSALDRSELIVHYQPKVSVATCELIGVEALIRWDHPTRGVVYPDEFIPLAEHTDMIGPLTRYVLDAALRQARVWVEEGSPLTVSVNLSARNLDDQALPDMVAELLTTHQVAAALLVLEVTESACMTDHNRAHIVLQRLSAMGVRLSIDDFGVGYTCLGQLKTLPVSELKIDKSFVIAMTDDPTSAVIVAGLIDLGHKLGLTIVAEGVETECALATLRDLGCDHAQGFYFSPSLPIPALTLWIKRHPSMGAAALV